MTFWRVTVFNLDLNEEQTFVVQASSSYEEAYLLDVLAKIHPEYETIRMSKIPRPRWIKRIQGEA